MFDGNAIFAIHTSLMYPRGKNNRHTGNRIMGTFYRGELRRAFILAEICFRGCIKTEKKILI